MSVSQKNPAGEYDTRLITELELERANECDKAMHLRPATYRKSVPHEPVVVDHIPSSLSLAIASAWATTKNNGTMLTLTINGVDGLIRSYRSQPPDAEANWTLSLQSYTIKGAEFSLEEIIDIAAAGLSSLPFMLCRGSSRLGSCS